MKNKFLSNKERNAINELYREHNFPNMNNQIARELGRVTNEQLLSAHLQVLPNFGLFCKQGKKTSLAHQYQQRLDLRSQQVQRMASPTELGLNSITDAKTST